MSGGSQGSSGSIAGMTFPEGPSGMRRAAMQMPGAAQTQAQPFNFGMSNPQQSISPLGLTQPQNPGGAANQNVLAQLEGRYVAPTGAGFRYHQGGSTAVPFNPLMLQQMLQQKLQQPQQQPLPRTMIPQQNQAIMQLLARFPHLKNKMGGAGGAVGGAPAAGGI